MITIELKDFDDLLTLARRIVQGGTPAIPKQPVPVAPTFSPVSVPVTPAPLPVAPTAPPTVLAPTPLPVAPGPAPAPAPAPITPSAPTPTPTAPTAPAPVPTAIPTTAAAYTLDDLIKAAMPLMDAGRQGDLIGLLRSFGVDTLPELPQDKLGAFATALRGMGAQI